MSMEREGGKQMKQLKVPCLPNTVLGPLGRIARLPAKERERVLAGASVLVDANETEAWDSTLNDGLD